MDYVSKFQGTTGYACFCSKQKSRQDVLEDQRSIRGLTQSYFLPQRPAEKIKYGLQDSENVLIIHRLSRLSSKKG